MALIFSIYNTYFQAGADATSDVGTAAVRWRHGYFSGTVTAGTFSATGAGIFGGTLTVGTGTIAGAKITGTTGSFTALLTAGTASISGAIIGGTTLTVGTVSATGNIIGNTTASGYYLKEGTNASMGTVTLAAGTANVATTKVTANSRIMLTPQATGTGNGAIGVSSRTAGTSFAIGSTNVLDDRVVAWFILEPA